MNTINEAAERERFEQWMRTQDLTPHLHYSDPFTLNSDGEYLFADIRLPWKAWKEARATLPQASGEAVRFHTSPDGRCEPSWQSSDLSWVCMHLTENTAYDGEKILREWNEMKRIALGAIATQRAESAPEMQASHGAAPSDLLSIGARMANVMFNYAQQEGKTVSERDATIFRDLYKQWDAARKESADSAADARDAACNVHAKAASCPHDGPVIRHQNGFDYCKLCGAPMPVADVKIDEKGPI